MEENKKMGWEVARDLEGKKRTILERVIPEWRHIIPFMSFPRKSAEADLLH